MYLQHIKSLFVRHVLFALAVLIPYLIWRWRHVKRQSEASHPNHVRELLLAAFFFYAACIMSATVLPWWGSSLHGHRELTFWDRLNLVPFRQFGDVYTEAFKEQGRGFAYFFANIFGSIALLSPLGIAFPLLWSVRLPKTVLYGFLLSLGIELLQLPQNRGSDVDDVLLNTGGVVIGCLLFVLLRKLLPRFCERVRKR